MPQDIPASPTHFAVFDGDLSLEWFAHYKNAKALAVDTEAMGLIHGRDRLCLVQICDDQDRVCCIRIARGQSDAPLLKELMENTSPVEGKDGFVAPHRRGEGYMRDPAGNVGRIKVLLPASEARYQAASTTPKESTTERAAELATW